ncbi:AAA family ATPase [Pelagicoccus enzymogenes]|uniref:AAA family ATPase n=1 Tax=Pelagicoccus enzymogenes TaxID=2773457 RepID=UPI00280FC2A8|nr:AAA family ATPase [Pelagicoccus enzymogenes]MDQ8199674.1 AAA family ATPase [Pelagicoccus enzymogenes]
MKYLKIWNIDNLKKYTPPADYELIGGGVLTRDSTTVLAGPPGVGKSLAITSLGLSGITQEPFFGFEVKAHFKTLVVQAENNLVRLHREALALPDRNDYQNRFLVTEKPLRGIKFANPEFRRELSEIIKANSIDVVVVDPLNSACPSLTPENFLEQHALMRECIGSGDRSPALVLVHHTRKGRQKSALLQHEVAGTYAITGTSRSTFCLQPFGDVLSLRCAKHNDGPKPPDSYWRIEGMRFVRVDDSEIPSSETETNPCDAAIETIMDALASNGPMTRQDLRKIVEGKPGLGRTTLYKHVATLVEVGKIVEGDKGMLSTSSISKPQENLVRPANGPKQNGRMDAPTSRSKPPKVKEGDTPQASASSGGPELPTVRPSNPPKDNGRTDGSKHPDASVPKPDDDSNQLGLVF